MSNYSQTSSEHFQRQLDKLQAKILELKMASYELLTSQFEYLEQNSSQSTQNLTQKQLNLLRLKISADELSSALFTRLSSEFLFPNNQRTRLVSTKCPIRALISENEGKFNQEIPNENVLHKKVMGALESIKGSFQLVYTLKNAPIIKFCVLLKNFMTLNIFCIEEGDGIIRIFDVFMNEYDENAQDHSKSEGYSFLFKCQDSSPLPRNSFEVSSFVFKEISKTLRIFLSKFEVPNFAGLFSLAENFMKVFEAEFLCSFCKKNLKFDEKSLCFLPPTTLYLNNFYHSNCRIIE